MGEAVQRRESENDFSIDDEIERLSKLRDSWLREPGMEFSGRIPLEIIESERKRINLTVSAEECLIDDDCPLCVAMSEDFDTPMFWFLDGCNMEDQFEFSFYKTREEWEEEQRRYEQFDREYAERMRQDDTNELFISDEEPF